MLDMIQMKDDKRVNRDHRDDRDDSSKVLNDTKY